MSKKQKQFPLRGIKSKHKLLNLDDFFIVVDNVDKWTKADSEKALKNATQQMGEIYLERIKANTPIRDQLGYPPPYSRPPEDGGPGFMRDSWKQTSVVKFKNDYRVNVKNDARFAEAVEYGHKQQVGKYVVQIKNHLIEDEVKGIETIKTTNDELEASGEMERMLEKKFDNEVKRLFNGK